MWEPSDCWSTVSYYGWIFLGESTDHSIVSPSCQICPPLLCRFHLLNSSSMAIVNLLIKPLSSFVLYRLHQDRGGAYGDFGIPGMPNFGVSGKKSGACFNIKTIFPAGVCSKFSGRLSEEPFPWLIQKFPCILIFKNGQPGCQPNLSERQIRLDLTSRRPLV